MWTPVGELISAAGPTGIVLGGRSLDLASWGWRMGSCFLGVGCGGEQLGDWGLSPLQEQKVESEVSFCKSCSEPAFSGVSWARRVSQKSQQNMGKLPCKLLATPSPDSAADGQILTHLKHRPMPLSAGTCYTEGPRVCTCIQGEGVEMHGPVHHWDSCCPRRGRGRKAIKQSYLAGADTC